MNPWFRFYLFVLCYGPRWALKVFPRRWKAQHFQTALLKLVRPDDHTPTTTR